MGPNETGLVNGVALLNIRPISVGETGAFYNMNSNTHKDGRCKLTHGQEDIGKEYAALALPKMSLLKPFFDRK